MHIIPFYSVEIGGIEINVIDGVIKILNGNFLYTDPASPPYDIMQYSPLYYYLLAGIARLFNISPADPQNIYIISRSVGLISNFLTTSVIYLTARKFSLSKTNSFLAGIFSFIILTQHYYSRGDCFYCLLFFTSIYFFLDYLRSKKRTMLVQFVIVSFLCILTKQSGVLLPVAIAIFLLMQKEFRSIAILAIYYLIFSLVFYFLIGRIGGIDAFYRNVVLGVKNGWSFQILMNFFADKYYRELSLWIILGFWLSSGIFKKKYPVDICFLLYMLLFSLLFAFVTGLKNGSSLNYFMECIILTFLSGLVYCKNQSGKIFNYGLYAYFLLTILLKTGSLYSSVYISHYRHDDFTNYKNEKEVSDYLLKEQHLKSNDLVYVNYRGYAELFLSGNSIMNQKDVNYFVNKYASPLIDYNGLLEQSDHGLIKYIIAKGPLNEVEMLGKHFSNFKAIKSVGNIIVYSFDNADF